MPDFQLIKVSSQTTNNGRVVYQYGKTIMYDSIQREPVLPVSGSGLISPLNTKLATRFDDPTYYTA
jgi:hypothetical protein